MGSDGSMQNSVETAPEGSALDRLVNREEVLSICFWFQGEGFGEVYRAAEMETFLNCNASSISAALKELVAEGHLEEIAGQPEAFQFTEAGKKQGGRLFGDAFSDLTRQGHGECADGCCDGDDHSNCGDSCTLH